MPKKNEQEETQQAPHTTKYQGPPIPNYNDPMTVLRMIAESGPPVLYARGDDYKTLGWRCGYCGPRELEEDVAFTVEAHDPDCPWRLAKELVDRRDWPVKANVNTGG